MTVAVAGVILGIILFFFVAAWSAGALVILVSILSIPATILKNLAKKP